MDRVAAHAARRAVDEGAVQGSHEALKGGPVITPALLEGLAANIASAAIREHMGPVYQPKPPQQN